MALFKFNKPKGFNHRFIYYNERKEFINSIKQKYNKNNVDEKEKDSAIKKEFNFKTNNNKTVFFGALNFFVLTILIILLIVFCLTNKFI